MTICDERDGTDTSKPPDHSLAPGASRLGSYAACRWCHVTWWIGDDIPDALLRPCGFEAQDDARTERALEGGAS
mgnify:FL=1